jgi:putative acetyltransferase
VAELATGASPGEGADAKGQQLPQVPVVVGSAADTLNWIFHNRTGTRLETQPIPQIRLDTPGTPEEIDAVREIFREYAQALGVDLCFQQFDEELASLPGEYGAPRGALLIATVDGELAGCCALRPLDSADYPNASEMKRLYVRKPFRGFGLGRQLAEAILDCARQGGYACVLLDTLDEMEAARALYVDLGFEEIPPYYQNPIPGAHYLKADLE